MATCVGAFADSQRFMIDEVGVVRHKREGNSYADKVIDGVALDTTLHFDSQGYMYYEEEPEQPPVKKVAIIQESTSEEIGSKKKKKKMKKNKNFKTKPKHSWHKRLSKVALELGDVSAQTEMNAQMEWQDFWDDKEIRERQEEEAYWDTWAEKVREEPGTIAYVQLDVSLDSCYRPVYDIDEGGVNRNYSNPHGWFMEPKDPMYNKLPFSGKYETRSFFTFWDEDMETYMWIPYNRWSVIFDYEPTQKVLKDIFWLSKERKEMEPGYFLGGPKGLSYHLDDLQWDILWRHMDFLRTGKFRNCHYDSGSEGRRSLCSVGKKFQYNIQIPNITFE
jgi:hypothetical protein